MGSDLLIASLMPPESLFSGSAFGQKMLLEVNLIPLDQWKCLLAATTASCPICCRGSPDLLSQVCSSPEEGCQQVEEDGCSPVLSSAEATSGVLISRYVGAVEVLKESTEGAGRRGLSCRISPGRAGRVQHREERAGVGPYDHKKYLKGGCGVLTLAG